MAEKLAVRKVKRKADGSTEVEIIDLATNKPVKDTKGYTIISAQDQVKQEKPDPKKPYAMRRVRFKDDGMLETYFIDQQGNEVTDLSKYNVMDGFSENLKELNLLPKEEVEKAQKEIDQQPNKEERSGEYYHGLDPKSPEAKVARQVGGSGKYISEIGALDLAKSLPGMLGLGAKGLDAARRLNNASVVADARKTIGIETPEKSLGPGQLGDVTINGRSYPVGFEAEETKKEGLITRKDIGNFVGGIAGSMVGGPIGGVVGSVAGGKLLDKEDDTPKRTNLTPDEARKRQSIASDQSKRRSLTSNAVAARNGGLGLMDLSPSFKKDAFGYEDVSGLHTGSRKMKDVSGITVHHTGGRGTPEGVVNTLNERGLGVHYVMDREGNIYKTAPDGTRVAHMRNSPIGLNNSNTLGIEVIGLDDKDITPEQINAGMDFINDMRATYPGIDMSVFGHGELNKHKQATEGMSIVSAWREAMKEGLEAAPEVAPTPTPRPSSFGTMIASAPAATEQMVRPSANAAVDLSRPTSFTDQDRRLMAATLAGEIDFSKTDLDTPEGIQEARGILSTMENRRNQYGSIKEAVLSPNQYSTWNTDTAANTAMNNYRQKKSILDKVVNDYIADPKGNLGYTHYYNASLVSPGWGQDLQGVTSIGPHTFGFMGGYQGAFGSNLSATADTQQKASKPTSTGLGTGAYASAKANFNTSSSSQFSGSNLSRGMMSDENADRSSKSPSSRSGEYGKSTSSSSDRGSYSSGIGGSSYGSSEGKGSYGSSGRSGYSSIGSSSGFGSSGKSSLGSSSGFGSYSRGADSAKSSTSKSTSSSHGYSGSRSDGWT
jgi:hypothetical protein